MRVSSEKATLRQSSIIGLMPDLLEIQGVDFKPLSSVSTDDSSVKVCLNVPTPNPTTAHSPAAFFKKKPSLSEL